MIKHLLISLSIITSLFGHEKPTYNHERLVRIVNDNTNLDFSDINGRLTTITLAGRSSEDNGPSYSGKSNLGLENNTNLKTIIVKSQEGEQVVRASYLPGVEQYRHDNGNRNFDFLSRSLPFLKLLHFGIYCGETLDGMLEDINKLEYLEELVIDAHNMKFEDHKLNSIVEKFIFTAQEMETLSKLYRLKQLRIYVRGLDNREFEFDKDQVEALEILLPNTQIILIYATATKTITLHQ